MASCSCEMPNGMTAENRQSKNPYINIHNVKLRGIVHSDDGETAIVVGSTGECSFIGVVDWSTGELLDEVLGGDGESNCITRLPLTQCFVVSTENILRVFRQDKDTKKLVEIDQPPKRHTNTVVSIAVSNNGRMIATSSWNQIVCIWDVDLITGVITSMGDRKLIHPKWVHAVAWSPVDEHILATACHDGHVRLFDMRVGDEAVATMDKISGDRVYNSTTCLEFDPRDGATIAVGYYGDGLIVLWDSKAPYAICGKPVMAHNGVRRLRYSPCGTMIVTTGYNSTVKLWDSMGLELLDDALLRGHTNVVACIDFNPSDPSSLLTCDWDGGMRCWYLPECSGGAVPQ